MKYKLVALDVDGTLINDEYRITERTSATIREVHRRGARIVLCTGRAPASTLPLLRELGLEGVVITHNGAATVDSQGPTLLHQYSFGVDRVDRLVAFCRAEGVHLDLNSPFSLYVEELSEEAREAYRNYYIDPIVIDDLLQVREPLVKITMYAGKDVLDRLLGRWSEIGDPELRPIRSDEYFIDLMHVKASKGNALRALAQQWDIDPSGILAIGNYYNDLDMLQFAGVGIAMGNAPDDVKKQADFVTASNNEDGVHLALQRYCLASG